MSDREARVRLNLESAGFLTSLRALEQHAKKLGDEIEDIGEDAQKASRKTGLLGSSLKSGLSSATSSLSSLASGMKSLVGTAATLGGALSFGAGLHGAEDLISTYKDISNAIEAGTGKAYDWQQVASDVEAVGERWKQKNEAIAASFRSLRDDVGDVDFARAAIDEVAKAATAGHGSIEQLTSVAGALNEKFGITKKELPDAMASIVSMANKGGLTMADFSATLGMVGSAAKAIGVQGPEGLAKVIGMMNTAEGTTKSLKGAVAGVSGLLAELADPDKIKNLEKLTQLKLRDQKGKVKGDVLEQVLVKTKGQNEALAKLFNGEQLKIMSGFGETFSKAFGDAKGSDKERSAAALKAFNASLEEASKSTLTAGRLQEQAAARLNDPKRQLDQAMNRFTKAFERPEVIHAVDELAEAMPKLASILGKVVGFAAEHPVAAAAAVIGAKVGGSGLASMGGELAGGALKSVGKSIGADIAKTAAASGPWTAAGKVMASVVGPALAAYVAFELGKAAIDDLVDEDAKNQGDLSAARAAAGAADASGDPKRIAAAKKNLEKAITQAKADEEGAGGTVKRMFRGAASFLGDVPVDPQADAIARAEADLRGLGKPKGPQDLAGRMAASRAAAAAGGGAPGSKEGEKHQEGVQALAKGAKQAGTSSEKAASALDRTALAAERLAKKLDLATGSGGAASNGLPGAPRSGSGSDA